MGIDKPGPQPDREYVAEMLNDPDHNFNVPSELKDVAREDVLEVAHPIWNRVMKKIRKERRAIISGTDFVSFSLPVLGQPGRENSLISVSTVGCMDAHRGDCSFCDYGTSGAKRMEVMESLPGQISSAFELILKENAGRDWALVNLTAIGSMFDEREIPKETRLDVYRRIAEMVKSKQFPEGVEWTTESRLKHVTPEVLDDLKQFFENEGIEIGKDLRIDVGYGIESSDPLILEGAMAKRVAVPYKERVDLLHQYGIKATAHTLFKPPFLTERESVEDAEKTVRFAWDNGLCDTMIVMTMNVRDATLVGELAEQGMYRLPSIWSVAEIMKKLGPEICSKTHFFGFSVATDEAGVVDVKSKEEKKLKELIMKFSNTEEQWQEIIDLFDQASGLEKRKWSKMMQQTPKYTLQARIATGLEVVGKKYLGTGFLDLAKQEKSRQRLKQAANRSQQNG
ncbi:hypothetical protein COV05_02160 [Candidatus Uhrbacteria bacterium CG10_big_fil_rev_8_21_14_0_10_48_16]|uniref:Elp3/MiaA/NifB-like radical SAM core domain-containing protein n=1 Tax=Candidatus Uhrbacteria bacterium CG10_big_fil_rev_8_21_14_0_10_48_16 TaxID=1975038 RepID=A0A2M8LHQ7_9BACT|nr:MAG: hypothetical protein COV05_02160 [Candidatus Uhrbacteria bacterium CG10_big_fil_rev_8_21_14_0_10_48_16]